MYIHNIVRNFVFSLLSTIYKYNPCVKYKHAHVYLILLHWCFYCRFLLLSKRIHYFCTTEEKYGIIPP